jgi:hypothetical protein
MQPPDRPRPTVPPVPVPPVPVPPEPVMNISNVFKGARSAPGAWRRG